MNSQNPKTAKRVPHRRLYKSRRTHVIEVYLSRNPLNFQTKFNLNQILKTSIKFKNVKKTNKKNYIQMNNDI